MVFDYRRGKFLISCTSSLLSKSECPSKCSDVPSALHCSASSSSARLVKFVKTLNLFPTFSNVENLSVVAASTTTLKNATSNVLSASLKGSSCDSYEKWHFVDLSLFVSKQPPHSFLHKCLWPPSVQSQRHLPCSSGDLAQSSSKDSQLGPVVL